LLRFNSFISTLSEERVSLAEAAEGANTHLTHIEDSIILFGSDGIEGSIDYLDKTLRLAEDGSVEFCVTTKYDGAPAVICGENPENGRFFVATKSLFNKTPKINYTDADIDQNHPAEGLNKKLKASLRYLKPLGFKEILQGDLLFTDDVKKKKIAGKQHLTFKPNTLTYAVPADSDTGKAIAAAKLGIVFHTKYSGKTISTLSASFAPNISGLRKTRDAWVIDASVGDGSMSCPIKTDALTRKEIERKFAEIRRSGKRLSKFLDSLSKTQSLRDEIMIYINANVRQGVAHGSGAGFVSYMKEKMEKDRLKSKSGGETEKKKIAAQKIIDSLESNIAKYDDLFLLHHLISNVKLMVISELRKTKMKLDAFVEDGKGFIPSAPEGFVVVNQMNNRAYKLVDRLDFSRKNFNLPKTW